MGQWYCFGEISLPGGRMKVIARGIEGPLKDFEFEGWSNLFSIVRE